jgi:cell division protein ZapA (FtsZ GTPase activity inhibitor)
MPVTEVLILGEKLTIKGDTPVEQTKELSNYINERVSEVCDKYPNIPPKKALILTLFNVAEELQKLRKEKDTITKDITETTEILAELFD